MIQDILHLRAPEGSWINDPNGLIYYKGKYHLFFQHFPYAPEWGTMHWGHAVSTDLIHWEHLPVALFPTKEYDKNGVFSGCAVEKDEQLYFYYTAVKYLETDPENIHRAAGDRYETSQALMTSKDGFHFDNWKDKRQVITCGVFGLDANARDPKVWRYHDEWYMILGGTDGGRAAQVTFCKSRDGIQWEYVNRYRNARYGRILECPDIFCVDGDYIFLGSGMYLMDDGENYASQALCVPAVFEEGSCSLQLPEQYHYIDYGLDLYAPQTNLDAQGRRFMIAWMRMPEAVEDRWNGMMCLPRLVEIREGQIFFPVHPSVADAFSKKVPDLEQLDGDMPYRIRVTMKNGERLNIGGYQIWIWDDCLRTDRSHVFPVKGEGCRRASTPPLCGKYELDIFVDRQIIEIYVNGGQYVLSHIVYGLGQNIQGRIESVWQM